MPIQVQQLHQFLAEHFALSGELRQLAGEIDLNYRLVTPDGRAFVLKVAHPDADPQNIDMQNALMAHLAGKHLGIQVPQVLKSTTHQETIPLLDNNGQTRQTRLLTWVEGRLWADLKHHDSGLLASLGHACGQLAQALADFDHPAAQRDFKWNLGAPLWIEAHLHQVEDPTQRALLLHFIELYKQEVLPRHPLLRTGVHYNDANDHKARASACHNCGKMHSQRLSTTTRDEDSTCLPIATSYNPVLESEARLTCR
jgi:Ser/Thr protein kinase RdoA (MazF antagonist)